MKKNVQRNVKMKISFLAGNFHWFPHISFIASDGTICLFYQQSELSRVSFMTMWGFEVCWKTKKCVETECLGHIDEERRNREIKKAMLNFYLKTL